MLTVKQYSRSVFTQSQKIFMLTNIQSSISEWLEPRNSKVPSSSPARAQSELGNYKGPRIESRQVLFQNKEYQ